MSYVMYAYRPTIGVAVCKRGDQWLLVEYFQGESDAELISESESIRLANRLGLIDYPQKFNDFGQLKTFLSREYAAAHSSRQSALAHEDSAEELLEFMDQATVLELIDELRMLDPQEDPRHAIALLEAIEGHSKFQEDTVVLSKLNPLKQAFKRMLGKDNAVPRKTQGSLVQIDAKFGTLNGTSRKLQRELVNFRNLVA